MTFISMSQTLLEEIIMRRTYFKLALSVKVLAPMLAALLTVGLTPGLARAQVLYGSLVGNVTDQNGAVVPGATITITNKGTNQVREATSGSDGEYTIANVLPGVYDVKVTKQGFNTFTQTDLTITANNIMRADVAMKIGNVSDVVSVTADATVLQTESATVKSEISGQEVNISTNNFDAEQGLAGGAAI